MYALILNSSHYLQLLILYIIKAKLRNLLLRWQFANFKTSELEQIRGLL